MQKITEEDFARSFGTTVDDLSDECLKLIREKDFSFRRLAPDERDKVILDVLKRIENDRQIIGAEGRKAQWERGWAENLDKYVENNDNLDSLVPKFIRENQPMRWDGDYIISPNKQFEYDFMTVFRVWLFQKYLSTYNTVCEFGAGTGLNLVLLCSLFPDKAYYGLDFVKSSVDLINKIGEKGRGNIKGRLFDMISPDNEFKLAENSAILTFGALEQLAGKFGDFIKYLLNNKPGICLHIEPTVELYDDNNLFDYLAVKFHRKRGYTERLLPSLQQLEAERKIKLVNVKRLYFGNQMMEGYTYFTWKPSEVE